VAFETLADLEEGRLPQAEAARLGAHAGSCASCRERLGWLSSYLPTLRQALARETPQPSASAVAFARSLARRIPVSRPNPLVALRVARLVFDTRHAAPSGARGERDGAVQRLFETESHVIDLWEEREASRQVYLIGQAHTRAEGAAAAPASATAIGMGGARQAARLDGAEFHFESLSPGNYHLHLCLPGEEALLMDLEIGG
jgi:hypothetical protein